MFLTPSHRPDTSVGATRVVGSVAPLRSITSVLPHVGRSHRSASRRCRRASAAGAVRSPHNAGVLISFCCAASCSMPSPVPTSCSNRSEKSASVLRLSAADAVRTGRQRRNVTRRAADGGEDLLPGPDFIGDGASRNRRQEFHERFEVVDRALAGARVDRVFGVLDQIAFAQSALARFRRSGSSGNMSLVIPISLV